MKQLVLLQKFALVYRKYNSYDIDMDQSQPWTDLHKQNKIDISTETCTQLRTNIDIFMNNFNCIYIGDFQTVDMRNIKRGVLDTTVWDQACQWLAVVFSV
jgi:hypothetical protein